MKKYIAALLVLVCSLTVMAEDSKPIIERLKPIPKESGFKMDDWLVWGGSVIKVGKTFHMFASRWPKASRFPNGYRGYSEIVRATSKNPMGPYQFQELVVGGRGGKWWDGKMCHNPKIVKSGDTYVLYYIGSAVGFAQRKIGYAYSKSIEGPWTRCDEALPFGDDHNNPAPYVHKDGKITMIWRSAGLKNFHAEADKFDGTYKIVKSNIFPETRVEDPDLHVIDGVYHLVVEDHDKYFTGHHRYGAHLVSKDGSNWEKHENPTIYGHTLKFTDGTEIKAKRRERPELFNAYAKDGEKGNGDPTHLLTSVLYQGTTWCQVQEIAQEGRKDYKAPKADPVDNSSKPRKNAKLAVKPKDLKGIQLQDKILGNDLTDTPGADISVEAGSYDYVYPLFDNKLWDRNWSWGPKSCNETFGLVADFTKYLPEGSKGVKLTHFTIACLWGGKPQAFTVDGWDGKAWQVIHSHEDKVVFEKNEQIKSFAPGDGVEFKDQPASGFKKLRLNISTSELGPVKGWNKLTLSEVEFFGELAEK